jgi:hypothetical protein
MTAPMIQGARMETNQEFMQFPTLKPICPDSKALFESDNRCPYENKAIVFG